MIKCMMTIHEPCYMLKFVFLENFQKPPGGLFIAARRLMRFWCIF